LRQVGGFFWVLLFPPPIKLTATTLATIIEDYAVINRSRNKVILVPGNAQNAGFYTI
jgi:hypothetical protein